MYEYTVHTLHLHRYVQAMFKRAASMPCPSAGMHITDDSELLHIGIL